MHVEQVQNGNHNFVFHLCQKKSTFSRTKNNIYVNFLPPKYVQDMEKDILVLSCKYNFQNGGYNVVLFFSIQNIHTEILSIAYYECPSFL